MEPSPTRTTWTTPMASMQGHTSSVSDYCFQVHYRGCPNVFISELVRHLGRHVCALRRVHLIGAVPGTGPLGPCYTWAGNTCLVEQDYTDGDAAQLTVGGARAAGIERGQRSRPLSLSLSLSLSAIQPPQRACRSNRAGRSQAWLLASCPVSCRCGWHGDESCGQC